MPIYKVLGSTLKIKIHGFMIYILDYMTEIITRVIQMRKI